MVFFLFFLEKAYSTAAAEGSEKSVIPRPSLDVEELIGILVCGME
jgi:hypothetical protein